MLHFGRVALGDCGSACPLALKGPFRLQSKLPGRPPPQHQAFQGLLRAAGPSHPASLPSPPLRPGRLKHLLPNCLYLFQEEASSYWPPEPQQGQACVFCSVAARGWLLWLHRGTFHHPGLDVLIRLVFQKNCIEVRNRSRENGQRCGNSLPPFISIMIGAQMKQ